MGTAEGRGAPLGGPTRGPSLGGAARGAQAATRLFLTLGPASAHPPAALSQLRGDSVSVFQEFIREGCLHKLTKKGLQQRMFFLVGFLPTQAVLPPQGGWAAVLLGIPRAAAVPWPLCSLALGGFGAGG